MRLLLSLIRIVCFVILLLPAIGFAADISPDNIKLYPLNANKSGILVQNFIEKDTPLLVFVYASWCPVCQKNFPYILKMAREHKKNLNILAFSMDSDASALQRYLASYGGVPFTPYIIEQSHSGDFTKAMNIAAVGYRNNVPFTALYDRKGKMIGQGSIAAASLVPVVAKLVGSITPEKH